MAPDPAHSPIGASSMGRLIACPASVRLSTQMHAGSVAGAAGGSSVYAAEGTVAHALAEEAITMGYDPTSQLDEAVVVDGHEVVVDADMVEAVRVYVAEVQRRAAGASWRALETRVCLDDYWTADEPRPTVSAFGTADMIAYHGVSMHLDVIDYKHGQGVFVDVAENPQLLYYAAGALLVAPGPVVTIDLTIVQPRARTHGAQKIRTFRTSAVDVLIWVHDVLKPAINESMLPGARISSGTHCRWCPARPSCPALAKLAQDLARRDFGPSPDALKELTNEELGAVLRDADTVEVYLGALRELALSKISSGTPVPGWSLAPSRPVRSWGDTPASKLEELLPEAPIYAPRALRTPAALEKLLTPEQWALVRPYVQSKSSGVRLVPDAQTGALAARNTARDDFA